jgi:V/A-type H+/Na+-transporting ATPase subunit I
MFRPSRLVKLYCTFSEKYLEYVIEKLQDLGMVHLFDVKNEIKTLSPLNTKNPELEKIEKEILNFKSRIESNLTLHEKILGPKYSTIESRKGDEVIIENAKNLLQNLRNTEHGKIKSYYYKILSSAESLEGIRQRIKTAEKFGKSSYIIWFGCFVKKEDVYNVMNALDISSGGKIAFELKDAKTEDNPPVDLANPSFIKPFEILTENYGLPFYSGFDPTILIAITFTLLFGIMFPDVGYGFVLVIVSLLVFFLTRKTTRFIRNLNIIFTYAGISSIIFGFLFGEFFGGFIHIEPYLFEPVKDVFAILIISIIIGLVHISTGLASKVIVEGNKLHSFSMLLFLWSVSFFAYFGEMIFILLASLSMATLFYGKKFYAVEEIFKTVSHVMSYLRIGILSIAHIIIAKLISKSILGLPQNTTGLFLGIVIAIIGIIFSLAIGAAMVFLQSLRLQWVEFLGEFEFGGKKFEPFGRKKEYIYTIR